MFETRFPQRMPRRPALLHAVSCLVSLLALPSCAGERAAQAREKSSSTRGGRPSPAVVDSARPLDESLRRFRGALPAVAALERAESSRDALVRRFVRAVERRDTTDLRAMTMSRAEFAYLYYPVSPHTRPPTAQAADLVWFLHVQASQKGVTRVLDRYGGRPLAARGHTCAPPRTAGENRVWDDCLLHLGAGGDTTSLRLFGAVIERGGRYKVFSYANDL